MIGNLICFFAGGIVGFFAAALCAAASRADLMLENGRLRGLLTERARLRLKPKHKPERKILHPVMDGQQ
ncbi:MAG: hypothetical protein DRQ02_05625 [Candidatus Latescibacterota bacterium]|nr:MAG: hypothetical protein DRQ02_05625 [Candidatus Latescibacterota bacterium]HDN67915.1 hypothetical protein [Bacillota bacterium]